MLDAAGTNVCAYTSLGQVLSEGGPWGSDTVSFTVTHFFRIVGTPELASQGFQGFARAPIVFCGRIVALRFMGGSLFFSDLPTAHEPRRSRTCEGAAIYGSGSDGRTVGAPVSDPARFQITVPNAPGRRPALRFLESRVTNGLLPPLGQRKHAA